MNVLRSVLLISLILTVPAIAQDETIATREKSFTVKFKNNVQETYVAKYRGAINVSHWESGGPAKPFEGKLNDDRQCHWGIETGINRELCLTSASGQQFCRSQFSRVYGTSFSGKGSDFKLTQLRPENCGDAEGRFRSDVNNAKNAVSGAIQGVVDNDVARVVDDLKSLPNVRSVERS